MTRKEYEREKLSLARKNALRILTEARESANQRYVVDAAGFALERWGGKPHPTRGRKQTSCPTSSSAMIPTNSPVASSDFSLST